VKKEFFIEDMKFFIATAGLPVAFLRHRGALAHA
jgi:hypothetical protein